MITRYLSWLYRRIGVSAYRRIGVTAVTPTLRYSVAPSPLPRYPVTPIPRYDVSLFASRSSVFSRFLAVSLSLSMILTAPGTTAWAEVRSQNETEQLKVTSDNEPGKNYKSLIKNPKAGGEAIQLLQALANLGMELGSRFVKPQSISSMAAFPFGGRGVEKGDAQYANPIIVQHDVANLGHDVRTYLGDIPVIDLDESAATPDQLRYGVAKRMFESIVHPERDSLEGGTEKAGAPASNASVASANPNAGEELNIPHMLEILKSQLGEADKSGKARGGVVDAYQTMVDEYKNLYVSNGVAIKINQYLLTKTKAELNELAVVINQLEIQKATCGGVFTPACVAVGRQLSDAHAKKKELLKRQAEYETALREAQEYFAVAKQMLQQLRQASSNPKMFDFDHMLKGEKAEGYDTSKSLDGVIDERYNDWKMKQSNNVFGTLTNSVGSWIWAHKGAIIGAAVGLAAVAGVIVFAPAVITGVAVAAVTKAALFVGATAAPAALTTAAGWVAGTTALGIGGTVGAMAGSQYDAGVLSANQATIQADAARAESTAYRQKTGAWFDQLKASGASQDALSKFLAESARNGHAMDAAKTLLAAQNAAATAYKNLVGIAAQLQDILSGGNNARDQFLRIAKALGGSSVENTLASNLRNGMKLNDAANHLFSYHSNNVLKSVGQSFQEGMQSSFMKGLEQTRNEVKSAQENANKVRQSIFQAAQSGDHDALAFARQNGMQWFDSYTGELSQNAFDTSLKDPTSVGHSYGDYSTRVHNTYSGVSNPISPIVTAVKDAWGDSSVLQDGVVGTIGRVAWAGATSAVNSVFEVVMDPAMAAGGAIFSLSGSAMQRFGDTYTGQWLQTVGASQFGNTVFSRSLGGNASRAVQFMTGVSDQELLLDYSSGQGLFNTRNSQFNSFLNTTRQELLQEGQLMSNGADVLSTVNIKTASMRVGSHGISDLYAGNYLSGAAKLVGAGLSIGGQTMLDMGSSMGVFNTGIGYLGKGNAFVRSALQTTFVRLPMAQFGIGMAHDMRNMWEGVLAGMHGDTATSAKLFGSGLVDFAGTAAGMTGLGSMRAGARAAGELGKGAPVMQRAQAYASGFARDFAPRLVFETGKLGIQGGLVLAGGGLMGGEGALGGALGGVKAIEIAPHLPDYVRLQADEIRVANDVAARASINTPAQAEKAGYATRIYERALSRFSESQLSAIAKGEAGPTIDLGAKNPGLSLTQSKVGRFLLRVMGSEPVNPDNTLAASFKVDASNPYLKKAAENVLVKRVVPQSTGTIAEALRAGYREVRSMLSPEPAMQLVGVGGMVLGEFSAPREITRQSVASRSSQAPQEATQPSRFQRYKIFRAERVQSPIEALKRLHETTVQAGEALRANPSDANLARAYKKAAARELSAVGEVRDILILRGGAESGIRDIAETLRRTREANHELSRLADEAGAHVSIAVGSEALARAGNNATPLQVAEAKFRQASGVAQLARATNDGTVPARQATYKAYAELERARADLLEAQLRADEAQKPSSGGPDARLAELRAQEVRAQVAVSRAQAEALESMARSRGELNAASDRLKAVRQAAQEARDVRVGEEIEQAGRYRARLQEQEAILSDSSRANDHAQAVRAKKALEAEQYLAKLKAEGEHPAAGRYIEAEQQAAYLRRLADKGLDPVTVRDKILHPVASLRRSSALRQLTKAVHQEVVFKKALDGVVSKLSPKVQADGEWVRSLLSGTDPAARLAEVRYNFEDIRAEDSPDGLAYKKGTYRFEITKKGLEGNEGALLQQRITELNRGLQKIAEAVGIDGLFRTQINQILQAIGVPRTFIVEGTGGGKTKVITPALAYLLKSVYGDAIGRVTVALPDTNLLRGAYSEVGIVYEKLYGKGGVYKLEGDAIKGQGIASVIESVRKAKVIYTTRDTLKQLEMQYSASAMSSPKEVELYKLLIDKGVIIADEAHQLRKVDLIQGNDGTQPLRIANREMNDAMLRVDAVLESMRNDPQYKAYQDFLSRTGFRDNYDSFYRFMAEHVAEDGSFSSSFLQAYAKASQGRVNMKDLRNPRSFAMENEAAALRGFGEAVTIAHQSENGYGLHAKAKPGQVVPMSLGEPNPTMRWSDSAMTGARQIVGARRLSDAKQWNKEGRADLSAKSLLENAETNGSSVRVTDLSYLKRFMGVIELSGSPQGVIQREAVDLGLMAPRNYQDSSPMARLLERGMNWIRGQDVKNVQDVKEMAALAAREIEGRQVAVIGIESNQLHGFEYSKALVDRLSKEPGRIVLVQSGPKVEIFRDGVKLGERPSGELGDILTSREAQERYLGGPLGKQKIAIVLDQGGVTGTDIKIPFKPAKVLQSLERFADGARRDSLRADELEQIRLDPAARRLFSEDGRLIGSLDQVRNRIVELKTSEMVSRLLRGDPLTEVEARSLKAGLETLARSGDKAAGDLSRIVKGIQDAEFAKVEVLKDKGLFDQANPAAREMYRGVFSEYLDSGPKFISVGGKETASKRLVQTVGRDRGIDVAAYGYHSKTVIKITGEPIEEPSRRLTDLLKTTEINEARNNQEDLYQGFVSALTENMLSRFDHMLTNIDPGMGGRRVKAERDAVISARKAFEKRAGLNSNLVVGKRTKAFQALQQDVVRLQETFERVTKEYRSALGKANRAFVDTMNQNQVRLAFNEGSQGWKASDGIDSKQRLFNPSPVAEGQAGAGRPAAEIQGLVGLGFSEAVSRIGRALKASDLDFEIGQPQKTAVTSAENLISYAQDRLAASRSSVVSVRDLLEIQRASVRAANSLGPNGHLPPVVGMIASVGASPDDIKEILTREPKIKGANPDTPDALPDFVPKLQTAGPSQRVAASMNGVADDLRQGWMSSKGYKKPLAALANAVRSYGSGQVTDSGRFNIALNAYKAAPALVGHAFLPELALNNAQAARESLSAMQSALSEAKDPLVTRSLERSIQIAQNAPRAAVESDPGYTVVREGQGAQAAVAVHVTGATAELTRGILSLLKYAAASKAPVTIYDPQKLLSARLQLEIEKAKQAGALVELTDQAPPPLTVRQTVQAAANRAFGAAGRPSFDIAGAVKLQERVTQLGRQHAEAIQKQRMAQLVEAHGPEILQRMGPQFADLRPEDLKLTPKEQQGLQELQRAQEELEQRVHALRPYAPLYLDAYRVQKPMAAFENDPRHELLKQLAAAQDDAGALKALHEYAQPAVTPEQERAALSRATSDSFVSKLPDGTLKFFGLEAPAGVLQAFDTALAMVIKGNAGLKPLSGPMGQLRGGLSSDPAFEKLDMAGQIATLEARLADYLTSMKQLPVYTSAQEAIARASQMAFEGPTIKTRGLMEEQIAVQTRDLPRETVPIFVVEDEQAEQILNPAGTVMTGHHPKVITQEQYQAYQMELSNLIKAAAEKRVSDLPKWFAAREAYATRQQTMQAGSSVATLVVTTLVTLGLISSGVGTVMGIVVGLPMMWQMMKTMPAMMQAMKLAKQNGTRPAAAAPSAPRLALPQMAGIGIAAAVVLASMIFGSMFYGIPLGLGSMVMSLLIPIFTGGSVLSFGIGALRHVRRAASAPPGSLSALAQLEHMEPAALKRLARGAKLDEETADALVDKFADVAPVTTDGLSPLTLFREALRDQIYKLTDDEFLASKLAKETWAKFEQALDQGLDFEGLQKKIREYKASGEAGQFKDRFNKLLMRAWRSAQYSQAILYRAAARRAIAGIRPGALLAAPSAREVPLIRQAVKAIQAQQANASEAAAPNAAAAPVPWRVIDGSAYQQFLAAVKAQARPAAAAAQPASASVSVPDSAAEVRPDPVSPAAALSPIVRTSVLVYSGLAMVGIFAAAMLPGAAAVAAIAGVGFMASMWRRMTDQALPSPAVTAQAPPRSFFGMPVSRLARVGGLASALILVFSALSQASPSQVPGAAAAATGFSWASLGSLAAPVALVAVVAIAAVSLIRHYRSSRSPVPEDHKKAFGATA